MSGAPDWVRATGQVNGQAPVETVEETPLAPLPEAAWRGIFRHYRDAMQGTTEASDEAHFATLWATVAVVLGRSVEMYGGDVVYPNVYLCVFGETGDKKTTAQRRIRHCQLLEDFPNVQLVHSVGTTEGLADALAESPTGVYLFLWEEFATFLSHARWNQSTLLEFFTECFDCPPEWAKRYRKNPLLLTTPTPSILTATTPEWFWKNARAEDFWGGWGNRGIFLTGAKKPPIPNPRQMDMVVIGEIKRHLRIIAAHTPCRAMWTSEARQAWDAFYTRFEGAERPGLLRAATKRAHVYVRKLAMTYAALEQTLPYVDQYQLEAAIAVVEFAVRSMERLLDLQLSSKPYAELEERFLVYIAKHPGERVRRLQQKMARYCGDAETFNRVLKSLVLADRIEMQDRCVMLSP